jgi:hypothetical protein
MPRSATSRQLAPNPMPGISSVVTASLAAPLPPNGANVIPLNPAQVFRVGDYEVGEGDCARLHGHPDIRY